MYLLVPEYLIEVVCTLVRGEVDDGQKVVHLVRGEVRQDDAGVVILANDV